MIYLILAGVLFLGALYYICLQATRYGNSFEWLDALKLFGAICAGATVLTLVGFLIKIGIAQLQGGM
jgi:hypothetical protein